MSERRLFLDQGIGESRGVVTLDGEPERLLIWREGMPEQTRLGARLIGRVRKVEPAFASAFVDLGAGIEALMAFRPEARPVQGQAVEVEIRSEPRQGKLATVRVVGPAEGAPRLVQAAPDLAQQLSGLGLVVEGPEARRWADRAQEEALETIHPLTGGGTLAIEPTRALVAIDVDIGERKGQDAKRVTRQANLQALATAARLLRLKGLGGIVIFDLVGRGHDGNALLTTARAAFAPDNPGVAIGPVGRFGTMEMTVPRRTRSVREILCDSDGQLTDETLAIGLIRQIEAAAVANPGSRLRVGVSAGVAEAAKGLASQLAAIVGARFAIEVEPGLARGRFAVAAQ